ncbi:MAG: peptidoglycan-associated lipoprotein Pal [bacterium]
MKVQKNIIFLILVSPMFLLFLIGGCADKVKSKKRETQKFLSPQRSVPYQEQEESKKYPTRNRESMKEFQKKALVGNPVELTAIPAKNVYKKSVGELASIFKNIYFDYDSTVIKNQNRPILDNIADWLRSNKSVYVMVEGHCDERGTNEYNLSLGEKRALSIRSYLIRLGISSDRLHTTSYGEEKPVAFNHDEAAWARNRRGKFLITLEQT